MKGEYKIPDFKFSDQDEARSYFSDNNLYDKINQAMVYLLDKLPVNTLAKDNTFDFENLQFNEGKSYKWFWLVNDRTKILIRQYQQHLTIYANTKTETFREEGELGSNFGYYSKTISFMLIQKPSKHKNSDVLYDNPYLGLETVLPKLIDLIENGKAHGLWNPHTLKRPKWLKVKLIFTSKESVDSVDNLMFACDEIFNMYRCRWAETDCIEILKTKKKGDRFGVYIITNINTEFPKQYSDPYYHAIGVNITDSRENGKKDTFCDVYSISQYYYNDLMHDHTENVKKAWEFILANHDEVFNSIPYEDYKWMYVDGEYRKLMHQKYEELNGEFDKVYFKEAMENHNWKDFIVNCWRFVERKNKC